MQYDIAGRLRASGVDESPDQHMRTGQLFDREQFAVDKHSPLFRACLMGEHEDCGVQVNARACGCECHRPRFEGMQ